MKYDVFISYRRDGGDKYARTIQQALEKQFRVFLDFDELEDGVFDQRIIDAISESPVFLLILSKGALDRCVNENDWVRKEILQAVKCGCHIVPVTIIGDNFNKLPEELPEELRRAVGSHQFSQLHMETLFKESMAKLVKTRIAPYIHNEHFDTGAEIHIEADADCLLFHFKKIQCPIREGVDNVVRLKRGKHKLEFVSLEYEDIKDQQVLEIPYEDYTDFIEVKMKDRIETKRKSVEEDTKRKIIKAQEIKTKQCNIQYKFSAGTNMGLIPKSNNDNFLVCPDLFSSTWIIPQGNGYINQGDFGSLLVVADGENHTGMVASAIAVETVQEKFVPESLELIIDNPSEISQFMINVLKTADLTIKNRSMSNKSEKGIYTSIVIAYALGNKLYLCWCGNCRCYVLNRTLGLILLSKDHTKIQELVDKGAITQDQVNNHPLSKVITRCLGDNGKQAQPEVRIYELHDDDIIMLCSDGLYSVCDEIQILDTMAKYNEDLMECKNELISLALSNGGYDNVTVALLKVMINKI